MRNFAVKAYLVLGICTLLLFAACQAEPQPSAPVPEVVTASNPNNYALSERTVGTLADGRPFLVHPSEIRGGGPPKDGIPSIDDPKFTTMQEANEWIEDNELVLAIEYKGVKRVYPLQIMVWHEIVNDVIAGDPIAITYCPLCGSGIAYHRVLDEEPVEFGTSGQLWNSNLIMYDRKTDTYWTQIDGIGILGDLAGQRLDAVSIDTVVWRDYKTASNLDAEVLTRETGHVRNYGNDPYGSYYEDSFLLFPVDNQDDTVHPKTVVFGVQIDGNFKAYKEEDLELNPRIEDHVGSVPVVIERDDVGIVRVTRTDTDEEVVKERDFWFAWYAFHPETSLYES